jgi:hypothetical protein
MKKEHESKATRIRRLILIEGASDAAIAKTVKCHVSYVWQVRKKLEKDIDADRGAKETLAHVRKITAAADTGVPPRDEIAEWKARNDGTPFVGSGVKEIFKQAAVDFNKILDKEYAAEKSILDEAQGIIWGDREKTYGEPDVNLNRIAVLWNAHLTAKSMGGLYVITPEDVCWMMVDLKRSRQMNAPKRDNLVDAAGYIGLIERIQK